ncbi:hypothetical protein PM082_019510 [Marasmius tenuissimus]|nr:hypothetical protein PM082_019510 [Marasmius tenuissimus]
MPSFADLKDKAVKAKDASVNKVQNVRDRNSSVPLKKTNWNPYNGEGPRAPPPPRPNSRNRPDLAPLPPPPRRTSSMASSESSSTTNSGPPPGPPPINRATRNLSTTSVSSGSGGPPPIVRSTRPLLSAQSSQSSVGPPPSLPVRRSPSAPPLPSRTPSFNNTTITEEPAAFSWGNLTQEDKEVFFGWLDEFFERSYGIKTR